MVKELDDDLQAARCRIEKLQQLEHMEKKFKEARDEKEMYKSRYEACFFEIFVETGNGQLLPKF